MTVARFTASDHLRYRFDRLLSKGTGALLMILGAASVLALGGLSLLVGFAVKLDGLRDHPPYLEVYWLALNRALDPSGVEDPGWAFRLSMICVSLFGITIVGTLIGILTTGISGRLEDLRRGRSVVVERDHTLILGWSKKALDAIKEIIVANESRRRGVIVILADIDKVELEDLLRIQVPERKNTEIICRRGDPSDVSDLALVQPSRARSILLFAEGEGTNDAVLLKRAMAVRKRFEVTGFRQPIIAEISDDSVAEAARALGGIEVVKPVSTVTRILVQAARQPGLSAVYSEILSFTGCEIYFGQFDELTGLRYADAVLSLQSSSVIGILRDNGEHVLNPPPETPIQSGDQLILIAADDAEIGLPEVHLWKPPSGGESQADPIVQKPENYVIFGWHKGCTILLEELNSCLMAGSQVTVYVDERYAAPIRVDPLSYGNFTLRIVPARAGSAEDIQACEFEAIDEFMIVSYRDKLDAQQADSISLITLIHLRKNLEDRQLVPRIATELLDTNNRKLAISRKEEDFIASDELISDFMAQLSENPGLGPVLRELMTAKGCEFYLKTAEDFGIIGEPTAYRDLVVRGLQNGITLVGYICRGAGQDLVQNLAPHKDETINLGSEDRIIVLAK